MKTVSVGDVFRDRDKRMGNRVLSVVKLDEAFAWLQRKDGLLRPARIRLTNLHKRWERVSP